MFLAFAVASVGVLLAIAAAVVVRRVRREIGVYRARERVVAAGSGLATFEGDLLAGTLWLSPEMEQLTGFAPGEFGGTVAEAMSFAAGVDDTAEMERGMARLLVDGQATLAFRILRADGELRWIEMAARVVTAGRIVGVASDVTERKLAEAELEHLARHDPLTRLPNREQLLVELADDLAEGSPGALLLLDLDGFKEINDGLGHGTGDTVLVEVGDRLRHSVRDEDLVARLGGDEFAIVMRDVHDPAVAVAGAERVLAVLAEPVTAGGMSLHVAGRIGIALWPRHGTTTSTLLQHADVAMYRAKKRGGCGLVYDALQDHDRVSKLALVGELRAALDADAIEVHYQPVVELGSNRIVGMEALARWRRPGGDVPPGVFVPLAEQTGLIRDLTPIVLRKALEEARRWEEDGLDLKVSVNMSARVLADPGFAESVTYSLLQTGLAPSRLILEITETALAEPTPMLIEALHELRASGVAIALDDFGAGYSSLGTLAELPVDVLKIDRSFLSRLPAPTAVGVVRAIIEMARHLGIDTVAEGVEGGADATLLRDLGCGFAQGYHFGRPAAEVDVESILGARLF